MTKKIQLELGAEDSALILRGNGTIETLASTSREPAAQAGAAGVLWLSRILTHETAFPFACAVVRGEACAIPVHVVDMMNCDESDAKETN